MSLLDKLGKKENESQEGSNKTKPVSSQVEYGTDLTAQSTKTEDVDDNSKNTKYVSASNKSKENDQSSQVNKSAQGKNSKADSTKDDSDSVQDPDSWTKDSAFKEIKKLREENKQHRLKYQEQLSKMQQESEDRVKQKEQEMKDLYEAKKELDKIKEEQEDKKRDLSEKVAHREQKIQELQASIEHRDSEHQRQLEEMQNKLRELEAEREAQNQVYKEELNKELEAVPEKFRSVADLIVKGAGDSRDALLALREAKMNKVFEDKEVIVNHSVPNANQGARATKERLDEAARETRNKMSSNQKIKEALSQINSGQPNSAFRKN